MNTDALTEKIADGRQVLEENQITVDCAQKLQAAIEASETLLTQEPGTVSPEDIQNAMNTLADILKNLEYKAADMEALRVLCDVVQEQKKQENKILP